MSFSGSGFAGDGSYSGAPTGASTTFNALLLQAYSVADASLDPVTATALAATPTTDTTVLLVDATPRMYEWSYSHAKDAWFGEQKGATP